MDVCPDYEDLFNILNTHNAQYLVVGAHAVIFYTQPRFTKDMDVWVRPTLENARKVYRALKEYGAPLANISPADFTNKTLVYQIGVAPVRIDILTGIANISFDDAWKNRVVTNYGKTAIHVIGSSQLIQAKEAANRDRDRHDLKKLLKAVSKTSRRR